MGGYLFAFGKWWYNPKLKRKISCPSGHERNDEKDGKEL